MRKNSHSNFKNTKICRWLTSDLLSRAPNCWNVFVLHAVTISNERVCFISQVTTLLYYHYKMLHFKLTLFSKPIWNRNEIHFFNHFTHSQEIQSDMFCIGGNLLTCTTIKVLRHWTSFGCTTWVSNDSLTADQGGLLRGQHKGFLWSFSCKQTLIHVWDPTLCAPHSQCESRMRSRCIQLCLLAAVRVLYKRQLLHRLRTLVNR